MKATAAGWLTLLAIGTAGALSGSDLTPSRHVTQLRADSPRIPALRFQIDAPAAPRSPTRNARARGAQARPDEIVTLIILATAPWTDTGITVMAGDRLEIRTWGTVRFGDAASASATPRGSGLHGGGCRFVVTDPRVAAHSVVGNIAPRVTFDGRGFFVGPAWKATVPVSGTTATEGRLLLGFNDSAMICDRSGYDSWDFGADNSGSFTAEIAITRAR